MAKSTWTQSNFNGGEWSPLAYGRFDLAKFKNGLALCQNYIPTQQGGLTRRPGFAFIAQVKDSTYAPRLQPFEFSITQAYVLEVGNTYVRIFANGAPLLNTGVPVEVVTPYLTAELWGMSFAQSADTLYIAHANHPPAKLQRAGALAWTYTPISLLDGPSLPVNVTATTLTPSGTQAVATCTESGGGVQNTISISNQGMGYDSANPPAISFTGGAGANAAATATVVNGAITAITVTNPGTGYTSNPTVVIAPPIITSGTSIVTASSVVGINATTGNTGTGFRSTDAGRTLRLKCGGVWLWGTILSVTDTTHVLWTIAPPIGSQLPTTATATANVSGGSVFSVTVTNGGSGYGAQPPSLTFGGPGSGAVAYANLTNGVVTSVTISVTGTGYSSAPVITIAAPTALVPATTTFWCLGIYNATDGYPSIVTFHQSRLVWGGAANSPGRFDGSNSGDYENQAPTNLDGTVVDSNAISFDLNAGAVNAIQWMSSDAQGLLVGTAGGEWIVAPTGGTGAAITPSNVNAQYLGNYGSAQIPSLRIGRQTLFVQRTGRKLREMTFQFMYNTFQALDISLVSEHLTKTGLKQLTMQLAPQQIIWAVRNDGSLIAITYDKDQETCGWHGHPVGGFSDAAQSIGALVESVASIPAPDITRDDVWAVVNRYVNGATVRTIELMSKPWEDGDVIANASFLDGGFRQLPYGGSSAMSGLTNLVGQTVGVLVDGGVHPDCVVDSFGTIHLNYAGFNIYAGLKYKSAGRTLCIESGGAEGPTQGKLKKVFRTIFRFFQSIGLSLESQSSPTGLDVQPWRSSTDDMDSQVALYDGFKRWTYDGVSSEAGDVYWETDSPLPSNITCLTVQLDTQDNQ
jgi:hypothetical protein